MRLRLNSLLTFGTYTLIYYSNCIYSKVKLLLIYLVAALSLLFLSFHLYADNAVHASRQVNVSLSYDDGLRSQLDNAIPQLDNFGFKATFYLLPSSSTVNDSATLKLWRNAASEGHELGNHTLFHSCSLLKGRHWVKPYANLDKRTVDSMIAEVKLANTFLFLIDGQQKVRSLTLPCGDEYASDGNYAKAVSSRLHMPIYGRTLPKDTVAYYAPHDVSSDNIITFLERSYNNKKIKLIILKFHGVGGDYLNVSSSVHESVLSYLNKNKKRFMVKTYLDLINY